MEAFIVVAIAAIAYIIYLFVNDSRKRKFSRQSEEYIKQCWNDYQHTLQGSDKKAALQAGRKYYGAIRGGNLTVYDEQAISNDLYVM